MHRVDRNWSCSKNKGRPGVNNLFPNDKPQIQILNAIDYCTKIETKLSPKNLLVESSKNNFIF